MDNNDIVGLLLVRSSLDLALFEAITRAYYIASGSIPLMYGHIYDVCKGGKLQYGHHQYSLFLLEGFNMNIIN